MSKSTPNGIFQMASALRSAKRVLAAERLSQLDSFTMSDHNYDDMEPEERRAIERFDRAITKINDALR